MLHVLHTDEETIITFFALALELDSLTIATACGALLVLNLHSREIEEVGSVGDGVVTGAWSPNGELLVLVSGRAQLLLLNKVRHRRRRYLINSASVLQGVNSESLFLLVKALFSLPLEFEF
jgi:IKI3 family